MFLISAYKKISFSKKIYISTLFGFFLGLFFGEKCNVIEPLNLFFIKIFQITIIPYMICSIVQSIGSLDSNYAKIIGKKVLMTLVALWPLSIIFAFGLNFALPNIIANSFYTPQKTDYKLIDSFVELFVPSNPFSSISNGFIPAIVVFFILFSIALINEDNKVSILGTAGKVTSILRRMNNYISSLLPLGVLIMSSYTFGIMKFNEFKILIIYIAASILYLVFISMAVYPALLINISKSFRYRDFAHFTMPAALVAFTTGSVFLALPIIYELLYSFDKRDKEQELFAKNVNHGEKLINIIVPLAWVLPGSYKFLLIFFIIFSGWYYNSALNYFEQILMYISGIPFLFGNAAITVPFLLNLGNLPEKAYGVYMLVSNFLVYFNNANAAIFIIVFAIIVYISVRGFVRIRWMRLLVSLTVIAMVFLTGIISVKYVAQRILTTDNTAKEQLIHMHTQSYNQKFYDLINKKYLSWNEFRVIEPSDANETLLNKILRTKTIQVGYNPESVPFTFFNFKNTLVGYDVDFIYDIAGILKCDTIEFYPVYNSIEANNAIRKGVALCIGGFTSREQSSEVTIPSMSYMEFMPAIVIPDKIQDKYPDFMSVALSKDLKIGMLNGGFLPVEMRKNITSIDRFSDFYESKKCDALLINALKAAAMSIKYPGFKILRLKVYAHDEVLESCAYVLPSDKLSETFREIINNSINSSEHKGKSTKRFSFWIKGESMIDYKESWSILGWLKKNY